MADHLLLVLVLLMTLGAYMLACAAGFVWVAIIMIGITAGDLLLALIGRAVRRRSWRQQ